MSRAAPACLCRRSKSTVLRRLTDVGDERHRQAGAEPVPHGRTDAGRPAECREQRPRAFADDPDQPYFDGLRTLATNGIDKPVLNLFRMAGLMQGDRLNVESSARVPLQTIQINRTSTAYGRWRRTASTSRC